MQQRRTVKCVHVVAEAGLRDDGIRPNVTDGEKVIPEEVGFDWRGGREDGEGDEDDDGRWCKSHADDCWLACLIMKKLMPC